VGSRRMIATNLPPEAQSVIVGSLLGDGYLTPNGSLQVEHRLEHAEYVSWKYEKLRPIAGKEPRMAERFDRRTLKTYRSVRFYTKAVLKSFRDSFYLDRRKIVPGMLGDVLDPMAVAVWFMDDGGRGARTPRGLVINTSGFSAEEQVILQEILLGKFGIRTSIHPRTNGFQIDVRAESFRSFSALIEPFLITQMRYKLPVDPVTTSPRRLRRQRRDSGPQ
jgi:hypothetical protein